MRTNASGVTENAEFKIDKEKFDKNFTDVFGERPKQFCDICEKRFAYCDCWICSKCNLKHEACECEQ